MKNNASVLISLFTYNMLASSITIFCYQNLGVEAFFFASAGRANTKGHHVERSAFCLAAPATIPSDPRSDASPCQHVVQGVVCVEVPIELPSVGRVVVLEATAESQEDLVNMALEEGYDDETDTDSSPELTKLNSGDPYGAVLWPAAYAVAAKVLTDPSYLSKLHNHTILELGAGTGLVSLALSLAGARKVIASDYEAIPLGLLEYAVQNLNPMETNKHSISYQLLDMRDHESPLPPADLVVASDIMYEPKTGEAMAKRAVEALKRGSRVLVGDSPGRPGREAYLKELKRLGVVNAAFVDTIGYTCSGPRHDLICGKGSTSVSETPQELKVAVMELDPDIHLPER